MQAAAALLALTACALVRGYEHGNVPAMPQTCQAQLDALYSQYYLPIAVLPSTENCTQIIQDSLADIGGDNCPSSALLRSCFNVSAPTCAFLPSAGMCWMSRGACNTPVACSAARLASLDHPCGQL